MAEIYNTESNSLLSGTSGNDTIRNGGSFGDYWYEGGSKVTIKGNAGNDFIDNTQNGDNSSINGGKGNDTIDGGASFVTIIGGKGNDVIFLHSGGNLIRYSSGDGNDTIRGFNESDTLTITGGSYSTQTSGNDVIVTVGKGKIILQDAKGKSLNINKKNTNKVITLNEDDYIFLNKIEGATLNGTSVNNVIDNWSGGSNSSINGGSGNDRIWNAAENKKVTINGGSGDDSIYNDGSKTSIIGGKGNDDINNYASNVTIDAGNGDDTVINSDYAEKVTIKAGKGNDVIYNNFNFVYGAWNSDDEGKKVVFEYKAGDGNDIIYGFKPNSKLLISDSSYSYKKSGDDIIVTVGKGKITLATAVKYSSSIHINSDMILTDASNSPVTVDASTQIIDASTRTKAIKITGNGLANTIIGGSKNDSLYGRAGNDSIVGGKGNDKLYGSNGNDTLVGGKGNDTLWGDAGNDKLYGGSGKDIFVYKPGEGTDTIFDYESGDMLKILKSNGKDGGTFTSSSFKNNKLTLAIDGGGSVIFDGVSKGDNININGTIHTISGNKLK